MNNLTNTEKNFNRSDMMKQMWAQGVFKRTRSEDYKQHMSKLVKEKRTQGNGLTPAEVYNKTQDPKLKHVAKGPEHHLSKFWRLLSPNNVVIEGFNLNDIVRNNSHLFEEDDIKPNEHKPSQCRAVGCIAQLKYLTKEGKPRRHQWKGWRLILLKDMKTGIVEFSQ